jgi:hypothetical protein
LHSDGPVEVDWLLLAGDAAAADGAIESTVANVEAVARWANIQHHAAFNEYIKAQR